MSRHKNDANEEDKDFDVLPVEAYKDVLLDAIRSNDMIICVGETGSGKTTKLPQFLLDAGLCGDKMIAVTQPRRVAATSVAARVADERHGQLGDEVTRTAPPYCQLTDFAPRLDTPFVLMIALPHVRGFAT